MTAFIALLALGLVAHLDHNAQRASTTGPGVIAGIVVNAQREPVAEATVQVFPAPTAEPQNGRAEREPFTTSAIGQATTDAQGRFRITGLPLGEYLVGARARSSPPSDPSKPALSYVPTF